MNILISFVPFALFAVLVHVVGPAPAFVIAAVAAAGIVLRGHLAGRSPKLLEVGTVVLFGALAVYAFVSGTDLSLLTAKLVVDAGMLAIVLVSMLVGQPFTLQYAREMVPQAYWASPEFVRVNYRITAVWAAAFLAIVLAEVAVEFVPGVPRQAMVVVTVVALVVAARYTARASGDAPRTNP